MKPARPARKSKARTKPQPSARASTGPAPMIPEKGLLMELYELYPATRVIENSYVLSMFWAWFSRIEWTPHVRIPLPRTFTYREP